MPEPKQPTSPVTADQMPDAESGPEDAPAPAPEVPHARKRWRQPRYRFRLVTGLVFLCLAAGVTVWTFVKALTSVLPGSTGEQPPGLADCILLGYGSFAAIVMAAAGMLCAMRPLRRARADFAKLAALEMAVGGLLVAVVLAMYWLWWSPATFIK